MKISLLDKEFNQRIEDSCEDLKSKNESLMRVHGFKTMRELFDVASQNNVNNISYYPDHLNRVER